MPTSTHQSGRNARPVVALVALCLLFTVQAFAQGQGKGKGKKNRPPVPGDTLIHTCNERECYNALLSEVIQQRGSRAGSVQSNGAGGLDAKNPASTTAVTGSIASEVIYAPVGGQRSQFSASGYPDCIDSLSPDISNTDYDGNDFQYIYEEGIPIALGSTHMRLSYSAAGGLRPSGSVSGTGGLFTQVNIRRSGAGTSSPGSWLLTANGYFQNVSSSEQSFTWGNTSLESMVALAELPGATSVPAAVDVEIRHYVAQDAGFSELAFVCLGNLTVTQ